MFETLSRSYEYAKCSYRVIWDHKKLIIFPILSGISLILVLASFAIPIIVTGTGQSWLELADGDNFSNASTATHVAMWTTTFLFYFCNYFVIVFFNVGLTACAMQVISGEPPQVGHGINIALKRLPQILGWAFLSAIIGVILKTIESSNEKAASFISAIIGMAWSALTFFVVPTLVIEGVGPIKGVKRSIAVLKDTWGTALIGNFSMGWFGLLLMLPAIILGAILIALGVTGDNGIIIVSGIGIIVAWACVVAIWSSAADVVFKAILYNYATGKSLPEFVDQRSLNNAFRSRD
ncbi:hypothetical protein JD969_18220 [Planctomycetota bacterium]|nr:hypothetical protein JD969_18220 [Planctomycetota bacterium]